MVERKPILRREIMRKREEASQADQFIDDLLPRIFPAMLEITSLREQLLTRVNVFDETLLLRFSASHDEDEYEFTYCVAGKSDRAFGWVKNPDRENIMFACDRKFTLNDSPNDAFINPLTDQNKGIAICVRDNNNAITNGNNLEACSAGAETLDLLKKLRNTDVTLLNV